MAAAAARVRDSLPKHSGRLAILAGDAGMAGGLHIYGRPYNLPEAISGSNTHWLRGYGDPPPEIVIAVGFLRRDLESVFESCELAGHFDLPFGLENSAIGNHTDIFVCRQPRRPWHEFWKTFRWFG
jgi:hypothetical protein